MHVPPPLELCFYLQLNLQALQINSLYCGDLVEAAAFEVWRLWTVTVHRQARQVDRGREREEGEREEGGREEREREEREREEGGREEGGREEREREEREREREEGEREEREREEEQLECKPVCQVADLRIEDPTHHLVEAGREPRRSQSPATIIPQARITTRSNTERNNVRPTNPSLHSLDRPNLRIPSTVYLLRLREPVPALCAQNRQLRSSKVHQDLTHGLAEKGHDLRRSHAFTTVLKIPQESLTTLSDTTVTVMDMTSPGAPSMI
ncbi:hypothetical protein BDZ45DRAFT_810234 [Acephala macrosclerotiorum]|nr:hypothetical protein BDZ45DRAFT_810234 [Acephala macrosclerotiorum]